MVIDITRIVSATISILFNYMLYAYLERLENISCKCSDDMRKNVIKTIIIVNYVLIFGVLFYGKVPVTTAVFSSIMSLVFAVYTFTYLYRLKNEKCDCSDSMIRDVYYYYYFITFLLIAVVLSMFVFVVFATLLSNSIMKVNKLVTKQIT